MKYFGKKSLSSVMSVVLHVAWYGVVVFSVLALAIATLALCYKPVGNTILSEITQSICLNNTADKACWEEFIKMPFIFKFILVPYFGAFVVLLLQIIKSTQALFTNFKQDIVFNKKNALIILKISKLNIGFALLTFNFSLMLVSVLLFMLCEIFKKGSVLQEEHDFTV